MKPAVAVPKVNPATCELAAVKVTVQVPVEAPVQVVPVIFTTSGVPRSRNPNVVGGADTAEVPGTTNARTHAGLGDDAANLVDRDRVRPNRDATRRAL
jgi:hypothetical protein